MKKLYNRLTETLEKHPGIYDNISREDIIKASVSNKECLIAQNGCLATWTPPESTGRSPKDTLIVKRPVSQIHIDWNSPNNLPMTEGLFDMVFDDAEKIINKSKSLYITDRVIGASEDFALPVKTVTDHALTALFSDNMFRPVPKNLRKSCFHDKEFTLISLPYHKLDRKRYEWKLRQTKEGRTTNMIVAMDFDRRMGIIIGSAYLGSVKKLMFTIMNYYLPFEKVLPLHCSANVGKDGKSALILGLSGTGKTTLSADPKRALLGDDEHGWSDNGIANFENGCYAKMIDIDPNKEPDIYDAVLHEDDYINHGAIVENAMIYPDGSFNFNDDRLTPNSRASYPLTFLPNIEKSSTADHPSTILFLTADAYGVLPPVSKLDKHQAMLWFLMGYTSKLAGTETGITKPVATFSRFFGQPFMPGLPSVYAQMLGRKMEKFNTNVFLINTGWTGGKYGIGKRIDLNLTRKMVEAALSSKLESVEYKTDELFHLNVPQSVPGVPTVILNPVNTWKDKDDYHMAAKYLAQEFSQAFDEAYGKNNISPEVIKNCPGK
ncbi:MAG: phosphoenolpyruvate carboxykinase (ATP) [Bacteroidales bacterium]